ncbi:MAG TPA: MgtC/SapB family protein [bacterium]|nr:MgtC/SapB family protein [bacterium]
MSPVTFTLGWEDIGLRLVLAAALSGVIGWERERLRKPAGFRTHILVGIGSALVMMVSVSMLDLFPGAQRLDPGRIASNVVVGIGFLGAGTILRSREGIVTGLTTAASLWVVSGIGLAVGCGFTVGALLTTALVMVVLYFMNWVDDYVESHLYHTVSIHARVRGHLIEDTKQILRDMGVKIVRAEVQSPTPSEKYIVVHFKPIPVAEGRRISQRLSKMAGVHEVAFD